MENYNQTAPGSNEDLFTERPLRYANFGQRLGAYILDAIILAVPNVLLSLAAEDNPGVNIISLVLSWLYFSLMESSSWQATIGKRAVGIQVVTTDGGRISFGQATGRYFGKIVSAIILLIGYLMVLWDDHKQALHDKMANTFVVNNETRF